MIVEICDTTEILRQAASHLRGVNARRRHAVPLEIALADLLQETADSAQCSYEAIQSLSRGADQEPGIAHGDRERAERLVASNFATILRVANGILGVTETSTVETKEGLL